jgi:hypothetical protein
MLIRLLAPFTLLLSKTPLATRCGLFRATFCGSLLDRERQKVLGALVERLTDALCYTAKWQKSSVDVFSEVGPRIVREVVHMSYIKELRPQATWFLGGKLQSPLWF